MHPRTAVSQRRDRRHHASPTTKMREKALVQSGPICSVVNCQMRISSITTFSYTHLTLPTNYSVLIIVRSVSMKLQSRI